tara:strand:- start:12136 stop:12864 length:729 start_codon:yes stop_codon:yes gene_type:complete
MKKTILIVVITLTIACKEAPKKKSSQIEPTPKKEWVALFDGKSFDGWHQFNKSEMSTAWFIEDGTMIFDPKKRTEKGVSNDIVTNEEYTNFELSLEWKISEKGNSGIFWGVKEGEEYNKPYTTGPEIQVLDNERHPDAFANPKFHQAGALYDLVQPAKDVCKPAGEWNHVILKINHNTNQGSVKLNKIEIVTFPLAGDKWDELIANSKFADWDHFGKFKTGKIGLQDHGDKVFYRNIKIREL